MNNKTLLILIAVALFIVIPSSSAFINTTRGFDVSAAGLSAPRGLATNGSGFWVTDTTDDWVYNFDKDGNNLSTGFDVKQYGLTKPTRITYNNTNLLISDASADNITVVDITGALTGGGFDYSGFTATVVGGITSNGSDIWLLDTFDNFTYHVVNGVNQSDGFTTNPDAGGNGLGLVLMNDGFWFGNVRSDFMSHYSTEGVNQSDGFDLTEFGIDSILSIAIDSRNQFLYILDENDKFVYVLATVDEIYTTFNSSVLETSNQNFFANVETGFAADSISAVFWYNGTSYPSLVLDLSGNNYTLQNNLDIEESLYPTANKSFFWELTFVVGSDIFKSNTTIEIQNVNRTYLSICNDTFTIPYINFTTKNATNPFPDLNASFKSSWSWFVEGGGSVVRNYSFEDVTETNHTFGLCMAESNTTYSVSSIIEVDGSGSAKNFHFLTNASLTNVTNNISLYLLDDTISILTELIVQDGSQNPLEDVIISIQFYDIGTDTFYTVAMAETSSEGKDLVYLNWYDSLYKFVLVQGGTTIKTTTPYKVSETPQIFEVITSTTFEFDKFRDFEYLLYFNETTNNFVLTFIKPSGDVEAGCLRVIKRNQTNDYTLCETCETSSSATVYCNVASYGNGTFIGTFYATGSLKFIDVLTHIIGGNLLYDLIGNLDGTVMAIIFSGVIMVFFFVTPVLGVIGLILGMLGGMALGFQAVDWTAFIGLTVVGGLVIWLLKR